MSGRIWHLTRGNLFDRFSPEELEPLERVARLRRFPRGSPIYLPIEAARDVYLLAEGRAKICHLTPDGKQSILAFIEPGEVFGELALVAPGPRDEYAEAVEACAVIQISGEEIQRFLERHPRASLGVTKLIGLRRKRVERRLKNLLFLSTRQRLGHLLLELAEQYGAATSAGIELNIRLSHQDLANVIGATRESVTVTLGELRDDGLIAIGRRRVTITRLAALAEELQTPAPRLPAENQPPPARVAPTRP